MSTDPIRKRRLPVSLTLATPIVLVVEYVLSIGRLEWLLVSGHISPQTWDSVKETLYPPLVWLVNNIPGVAEFMNWYVVLWRP